MRERHAGRQDFLQFKHLLLVVESKLVAAAFGSLNDDLYSFLVIFVVRLEARWISQRIFRSPLFVHKPSRLQSISTIDTSISGPTNGSLFFAPLKRTV